MKAQMFVLRKEKTALDIQVNTNTELQRSYVNEITRLSKELTALQKKSDTQEDDSALKKQIKELMVSLELIAMNYERHVGEYAAALDAMKRENR